MTRRLRFSGRGGRSEARRADSAIAQSVAPVYFFAAAGVFVTTTNGAGFSGSAPLASGAEVQEFFPFTQVCTVGKSSVPVFAGAVNATPKLAFALSASGPPVKVTIEFLNDDVQPFGATPETLVTVAGTLMATDVVGEPLHPCPMTNDTVAVVPGLTCSGEVCTCAPAPDAAITSTARAAVASPREPRAGRVMVSLMTGRTVEKAERSIGCQERDPDRPATEIFPPARRGCR